MPNQATPQVIGTILQEKVDLAQIEVGATADDQSNCRRPADPEGGKTRSSVIRHSEQAHLAMSPSGYKRTLWDRPSNVRFAPKSGRKWVWR
jgi:hypothetical protein